MKLLTCLLKHAGFLLVGFFLSCLLGYFSHPAPPLMAQITVSNTAAAEFQGPSGETAKTPSNSTEFDPFFGVVGPETPPNQSGLEIFKTADRAAAEPGDTVLYRLLVRNKGNVAADPLIVTDQLPLGLQFVTGSVRTSPETPELTRVSVSGNQITFEFGPLAAQSELSIVYAVLLTPDAIRGSGLNTAQASSPQFAAVTATFQLTIRPGILADCGTIVGRVFVDRNFDGEQQPGEPGVPNAVVYMDDGNRIITDPNGLFSVINVVSGNRVGTLDLFSLPGYTLAPNLYRLENNSQSRLVRLAPGGLARMNFAVTPTFGEGQE